jgi:hypothetical protein
MAMAVDTKMNWIWHLHGIQQNIDAIQFAVCCLLSSIIVAISAGRLAVPSLPLLDLNLTSDRRPDVSQWSRLRHSHTVTKFSGGLGVPVHGILAAAFGLALRRYFMVYYSSVQWVSGRMRVGTKLLVDRTGDAARFVAGITVKYDRRRSSL